MPFARWLRPDRVLMAMVAVAAGVLACRDTTTPKDVSKAVPTGASETMGVGFTTTLIARGNLGTFHVQSNVNGYNVVLNSPDNTDIAVANVDIIAGGSSGWHYHPGPVVVVVKSGTITFYSSDDRTCSPKVHPAGTSFIEPGGVVGNARNEGGDPVAAVATFFATPGVGTVGLRIDAPKPDNCA